MLEDIEASNSIETIRNFVKLSDTIATAGQPERHQFAAIADSGYQIVINLALPTSTNALPDEQTLVETYQMNYVHIPVSWEDPTLQDFEQFVNTIQSNAGKSLFIHCAMNMRVSAFMYLYRRIYQGLDEPTAKQDLNQIWQPNDRWQNFIQHVLHHYQVT